MDQKLADLEEDRTRLDGQRQQELERTREEAYDWKVKFENAAGAEDRWRDAQREIEALERIRDESQEWQRKYEDLRNNHSRANANLEDTGRWRDQVFELEAKNRDLENRVRNAAHDIDQARRDAEGARKGSRNMDAALREAEERIQAATTELEQSRYDLSVAEEWRGRYEDSSQRVKDLQAEVWLLKEKAETAQM